MEATDQTFGQHTLIDRLSVSAVTPSCREWSSFLSMSVLWKEEFSSSASRWGRSIIQMCYCGNAGCRSIDILNHHSNWLQHITQPDAFCLLICVTQFLPLIFFLCFVVCSVSSLFPSSLQMNLKHYSTLSVSSFFV